jgi:hypothetical protein
MTDNKVLRRGAVVVLAAVLALVVRLVLPGPAVRSGSDGPVQPVGPGSVFVVALLAGLLGWALLALLERVTARGRTVWTVIAVVVLLLSLLGPLGGVTGGDKVSLLALHLIVGVTLILGLPMRPRRGAAGDHGSAPNGGSVAADRE